MITELKKNKGLDANTAHKVMLAVSDAIAIALAFYLSFTLRNYFFSWRGGVYTPNIRHAIFLLALIPTLVAYFRANYLYRSLAMRRTIEHLELLSKSWLFFFAFFLALIFFLRMQLFAEHRITMTLFFVIGWLLMFTGRFIVVPSLVKRSRLYERKPSCVLCIGTATEAIRVRDIIVRESDTTQHVLGYISDQPGQPDDDAPRYLGKVEALPSLLETHRISEVFIRLQPADWNAMVDILKALSGHDTRLRIAVDQFGAVKERVPLLPEAEYDYLFVNISPLYRFEGWIKRIADRILASIALVLLSPLFAILAIRIKLDSPGPVFFHQNRVGKDGRIFNVMKFRTMRSNTEDHHKEAVRRIIEGDHDYFKANTGAPNLLKATDTAQITPFGQFLRKSSLDELPQLINVVRGDMSLVGPRPLPVYEVELFKPWQHVRHTMRPGITGFWQVFGRSAVSHENTILMDIFYIMNWSLSLDARILVRTIFVLLTGKGAL
ncbi:MAG TPA: sugar transferase [Kiritimatiellia bacterium]|nr:sugar transferase [Kiritimatiellia bacterium]